MKKLFFLVSILIFSMQLFSETIIISGTSNFKDAKKQALKAKGIFEKSSLKADENIKLKKEGNMWLVKVNTPSQDSPSGRRLISKLSSIFPGMLIMSKSKINSDTPNKQEVKSQSTPSSINFNKDGNFYWQWLLLLILDIVGWIAYRKRRKKILLLKNSQDDLDFRQHNIWEKLQKETM